MDVNLEFQQLVTLTTDAAFRGLYEGYGRTPLGDRALLTIIEPGATPWNKLSIRFFPLADVVPVESVMRGGAAQLRMKGMGK